MWRLAVVIVCISVSHAALYDGYQVVKVVPKNDDHLHILQRLHHLPDTRLEVWNEHPVIGQPVLIQVSPDDKVDFKRKMAEHNMPVTVTVPDIQREIDEQERRRIKRSEEWKVRNPDSQDIDFEEYHDWAELDRWLGVIANTCGSRCSIHNIGQSNEGRNMRVLKVTGNGSATRSVLVDSGIHAREWISPATNVWVVNNFVKNYESDAGIRAAVDRFDWYFLLVANPDGYAYTWTDDRMWRKTRTESEWDTCRGADPNRNFDIEWDRTGSSADPCSGTYAGDAAFSEPCVRNIRDVMATLGSNMTAYINLHSFSQFWLSPWAYTAIDPVDIDEMDRLGNIAADAIFASSGDVYTVGPFSTVLYIGSGVSVDWAYSQHNTVYSYTPELPDTGFWGFILPPEFIQPTGDSILAAFIAMAREMRIP